MRKIVYRPHPTLVPEFPMPLYVRSAGYNEAEFNWSEKWDPRPFVQIFWCVQGCGEFILGEDKYTLNPGEVFFYLPMEEHQCRSIDPATSWKYYWFTFDGEFAEKFMLSYGYPRKNSNAGECPAKLFSELEILIKKTSDYARRHALAVAAEILARIGGRDDSAPVESLIRRFLTLAQANICNPEITVADLAKKLGIHRMTLNKHLKEEMGITPGEYLDGIRRQRAMRLLRDTDLPLKEIAEKAGIANQSYFCRLIRETAGVSPMKYRKKFRDNTTAR